MNRARCRCGVRAKAALLSSWFAFVATARAEPRTDAGLVWQAPSTCPDGVEVRARIERRLGMPIDRAVHGIEVEIASEGGGGGGPRSFVARIDLRGVTVANEIRVLSSARCDELTDAVAVVIARVAMENRQPPDEDRSVRIAVHAPEPEPPQVWGGGVRTLGISGVGAQPRVGVGGELAAYARHQALYAELAQQWWLPSSRTLHSGAPGRVDIRLQATALRLGWGPASLPLRGWVAGELGSIEGKGIALNNDHIGTAMWVGVGGGVGVAWPMTPRVRLVGVIEVAVPFQRPRFVLQDGTDIYRPDQATARCGLGLEVGWQ
jgi:hypothetical protein